MNLREIARGQECQIRVPAICNHNPETTVLAHYRLTGTCGTGLKPIDEMGAWACSSCHDYVDARSKGDATERKLYHLDGVLRTLNELKKLGYGVKKL